MAKAADEHKRAFEAWVSCGKVWTETSRLTGISYPTIQQWASKEFACKEGCHYHDWITLSQSMAVARHSSTIMQAVGASDNIEELTRIDQDQAVTEEKRASIVQRMLQSDVQRLCHWEILYAIVYKTITGIELPIGGLALPTGVLESDIQAAIAQTHAIEFEDAVHLLATIQDRIKIIKKEVFLEMDPKAKKKQVRAETIDTLRAKAGVIALPNEQTAA